jgi:oxygen-dependent protoporphyrinogen oxidase
LVSDVLSLSGRLRVLGEPFVPPRRSGQDESVFEFARRRIGREAATVLVDAFVTGIWAGNADDLSLRSALPKLHALERDHGGLVRGMIARRGAGGGAAGPTGRLTSFPGGLEELIGPLAAALGPRLRLGARVTRIERLPGGDFRLAVEGAPAREASTVVLACPSWRAAPLLEELDGPLAAAAAESRRQALRSCTGPARRCRGPKAGFRALTRDAWFRRPAPSNIFSVAPEGHVLATAVRGGDPSAVEASDRIRSIAPSGACRLR